MSSIGLSTDFALQEPALTPTDILRARLIEHGLAHQLTWTECSALMDIHESAVERMEGGDPWADLHEVLDEIVAIGRALPNEPVKIAYYLRYGEIVTGQRRENLYPKFWGEADANEAFLFKLHPSNNPGDHTGIKTLTRDELESELKVSATMPLTRWVRERIRRLTAESEARRHRRI